MCICSIMLHTVALHTKLRYFKRNCTNSIVRCTVKKNLLIEKLTILQDILHFVKCIKIIYK